MSWPEPVRRVAAVLEQAAAEARLEEFPDGAPTAEAAARGGKLAQIVRSEFRVVPSSVGGTCQCANQPLAPADALRLI
jgi:hypothetical protein